ncbi:MAG: ROK family glucokinase [Eubacteriales bacterium]|nr:ROK family glucokinase [Eubacteriales bacterium]
MKYIGIDVGGTHMAAGVVDEEGVILAKAETPTLPGRPFEVMIEDMGAIANKALKQSGVSLDDVACIGVGIPGIADNEKGDVIFCTNLFWKDEPLRRELQKHINKPIWIENDATVAGFAENAIGVSRGCKSSVFLTIGTGLGGGIVIDGKPWTGAHGVASELGHLTMVIDGEPCTCGKDGCMERYCSATALIRMGKEMCIAHPDCDVNKRINGKLENLNAKIIIDSAKDGDSMSLMLFNRYTRYLALALNTIVSFLDPEMIVLGGGVSHAGEFLLNSIVEKIPQYLMFKTMPFAEVHLATLGNDAGLIGSALLAREMIRE